MNKSINKIEKIREALNDFPIRVKQRMRINSLEVDLKSEKNKIKELQNIIKSDLYKDFMEKLEAPHKIVELKESLKMRTQQRNAVREDNTKLREELKKQKEYNKNYDLVVKQRDKYKKQIKTLKDVIKESK